MSEEGGWGLDFPNEPGAASIDEMPTPMVTLEQLEELGRQESSAYHKMSLARTAYEEAHAEYIRISDRLNDLKIRNSHEPH